ncbi:MAG: class I SAM-dependent methyltransferase [Anaerolineae bacterium]
MPETRTETYDEQTIEDLAQFTGYAPETCIQRLQSYQFEEMAEAWRIAQPRSSEEIRRFYEDTDLYIWELTNWTSSTDYNRYWNMVETLIERFPPHRYPRVIDYGSGVGAVALRLAEAGYQITLADVRGKTLEYAEFRLRRRGYQFELVHVVDERPALPHDYDIFISFDVFEHIPHPDHLLMHLMRWLRPLRSGCPRRNVSNI